MKKLTAAALSAALIALSPGLASYEALAAVTTGASGSAPVSAGAHSGAPRTLSFNGAPIGGAAFSPISLAAGVVPLGAPIAAGVLGTAAGRVVPAAAVAGSLQIAAGAPIESPASLARGSAPSNAAEEALPASRSKTPHAVENPADVRANFKAAASGETSAALAGSESNPDQRGRLLDSIFQGRQVSRGSVGADAKETSASEGSASRRLSRFTLKAGGIAAGVSGLLSLPAVLKLSAAAAAGKALSQDGGSTAGIVSRAPSHPLTWAAGAVVALGVSAFAQAVRYFKQVRGKPKSMPSDAEDASAPLPSSFSKAVLPALFLLQFGTWAGSPLIPKLAGIVGTMLFHDPTLSVLGQLAMFLTMVPGTIFGKKMAVEYNSALTLIVFSLVSAAAIGSVSWAASLAAAGALSHYGFMAVFLASRALTGFVGAAVMGVAQTEIIKALVPKTLHPRANALYGLPNKLMGVFSTALFALLSIYGGTPTQGHQAIAQWLTVYGWFAAAAAASLLTSVFLFARTEFPEGGIAEGGKEKTPADGASAALPSSARQNAYVTAFFLEMAFFGIVGPIAAPLAFGADFGFAPTVGTAMMGAVVAAFSLGGLIVTGLQSLSSKKKDGGAGANPNRLLGISRVSEMQWFGATAVAWPLFLAAMLIAHNPALTLLAALVLGAMNMGAFNGLKTDLQKRVPEKIFSQFMEKQAIKTYGLVILSTLLLLAAGAAAGAAAAIYQFYLFAAIGAAVAFGALGIYRKLKHE